MAEQVAYGVERDAGLHESRAEVVPQIVPAKAEIFARTMSGTQADLKPVSIGNTRSSLGACSLHALSRRALRCSAGCAGSAGTWRSALDGELLRLEVDRRPAQRSSSPRRMPDSS